MFRRFAPALKWAAFTLTIFTATTSPLIAETLTGTLTFEVVSEKRIGRTTFEYLMRGNLAGVPTGRWTNVRAVASSSAPATVTVMENTLEFGTVNGGTAARSQDTFTLRLERTQVFNPTSLSWAITGTGQVVTVSAPTLGALSAPASVLYGQFALVSFDYADVDGDFAGFEITRTTTAGSVTRTVPRDALTLSAVGGNATVPLSAEGLPPGDVTWSIKAYDAGGRKSAAQSVTIRAATPLTGNFAPYVEEWTPLPAVIARPLGGLDRSPVRFRLKYFDGNGNLVGARLRLFPPGGGAPQERWLDSSEYNFAGIQGTVEVSGWEFNSASTLGQYRAEITLYDAAGVAASFPSEVSVQLQDSGIFGTPHITSVTPTSGIPGAEVTIAGYQFTLGGTPRVEFNDVSAELISFAANQLVVRVPAAAATGGVRVLLGNNRSLVSPTTFTVPVHVELAADGNALTPGETLQLSARANTRLAATFVWLVDGVAGGSSAKGTVSPAGLYTAPNSLPPPANGASPTAPRAVTITARLVVAGVPEGPTNPSASFVVTLAPPAALRSALIRPGAGGSVRVPGSLAALDLPANALSAPTTISLQTLIGTGLPAPLPGRRTLGAVICGPDGTTFNAPVQVTIPLVRAQTPNSRLTLRFWNAATSAYTAEVGEAVVSPNGDTAIATIMHFSIPVVDEAAPAVVPTTAPVITTMSPGTMEEGRVLPVVFTGSGLTSDISIEIYEIGGARAEGLLFPSALYVQGTQAACTLYAVPNSGLPAGATQNYRIRLVRPNGLFSEKLLTVQGLDEFVVGNGDTLTMTDPAPRRVSRVQVTGRVRVLKGLLDITSTGPAEIDGMIDGAGADGKDALWDNRKDLNLDSDDPANNSAPGGLTGGAGGIGRRDGAGAENENFGRNGLGAYGPVVNPAQGLSGPFPTFVTMPAGIGGVPGENYEVGLSLLELAACIGTGGIACVPLVINSIAEAIDAENLDTAREVAGARGLGGAHSVGFPSAGGGGGGGGGRFQVDPGPALPAVNFAGGGGGAGGDGGAAIRLAVGGELSVSGRIDTSGGDGGDGSEHGRLIVDFLWGWIVFYQETSSFALPGGSGGGGAGGIIELLAARSLIDPSSPRFAFPGGTGGTGGQLVLDPEADRAEIRTSQSTEISATSGDKGAAVIKQWQITDEILRTEVTPRRLHWVSLSAPGAPFSLEVRHAALGTTERYELTLNPANQRREGFVALAAGLNTVLYPAAEVAQPQIFVVGLDRDNDGLGDLDEATFGTNPDDDDSDDDGLSDGLEALIGSDPLQPDSDGDGMRDGTERVAGTKLNDADTDDDGFSDGAEILLGSDPLVAGVKPTAPPAGAIFASVDTGAGTSSTLAVIDLETGEYGTLAPPAAGESFGLAFDLAATLQVARTVNHGQWNPWTETFTAAGSYPTTPAPGLKTRHLAYSPPTGSLFGIGLDGTGAPTGQLLQIVPNAPATSVPLGAPRPTALRSIAVARDGRLFAAVASTALTDRLVELDPTSGALLRDVGPLGATPVLGLVFARGGQLWAAHVNGVAESRLLVVSTVSAATAEVARIPRRVTGLTVAPAAGPITGAPIITTPLPLHRIQGLRPVDFDGDGKLDLAAIGQGPPVYYGSDVVVFFGDGAGHFATRQSLLRGPGLSTPSTPGIVTADFNGDGHLDLAWGNPSSSYPGPETIGVALGQPGGLLGPVINVPGMGSVLGVGQFNPAIDMFPDLVLFPQQRSLLLGNGAGDFTTSSTLNTITSQIGAVGDFDDDGVSDFTTGTHAIRVSALGGLAAPFSLGVGYSSATATADFDGDGRDDIATANQYLRLFRSSGVWDFTQTDALRLRTLSAQLLFTADIDGDERPDVVVFQPNTQPEVFLNRGLGAFALSPWKVPGPTPYTEVDTLSVADFNGDGWPDIVVARVNNGGAPPQFEMYPGLNPF